MSVRDPMNQAGRQFHLRYSFDPIILATFKDIRGDQTSQELINSTPPYVTGNASLVRDARRALVDESQALKLPIWISIRDAETGEPVSIQEIRLIAALFCDSAEDEES